MNIAHNRKECIQIKTDKTSGKKRVGNRRKRNRVFPKALIRNKRRKSVHREKLRERPKSFPVGGKERSRWTCGFLPVWEAADSLRETFKITEKAVAGCPLPLLGNRRETPMMPEPLAANRERALLSLPAPAAENGGRLFLPEPAPCPPMSPSSRLPMPSGHADTRFPDQRSRRNESGDTSFVSSAKVFHTGKIPCCRNGTKKG